MLWKLVTFVGMVAVVFIVVRLLSARKQADYEEVSRENGLPNPYHAVSIRYPMNACEAAKQLTDKRFLANEAPKLPLPKCTASSCHCRYEHYEDRRGGEERRVPFKGEHSTGPERRAARADRRRS
jgi:hypothetical protein